MDSKTNFELPVHLPIERCHSTDFDFRLKGSESVLVKVGPISDDCWILPKELLVSRSKFFQVALSGEWSEAKSRVVELPEEEPSVFEVFIGWLYSGKVARAHRGYTDENALKLFKAWILGDKLDCGDFKDLVLDLLICTHPHISINPTCIEHVFRQEPARLQLMSIRTRPVCYGLSFWDISPRRLGHCLSVTHRLWYCPGSIHASDPSSSESMVVCRLGVSHSITPQIQREYGFYWIDFQQKQITMPSWSVVPILGQPERRKELFLLCWGSQSRKTCRYTTSGMAIGLFEEEKWLKASRGRGLSIHGR